VTREPDIKQFDDNDDFVEALARLLFHSREPNDLTILECLDPDLTRDVVSELRLWADHSASAEERKGAALIIRRIKAKLRTVTPTVPSALDCKPQTHTRDTILISVSVGGVDALTNQRNTLWSSAIDCPDEEKFAMPIIEAVRGAIRTARLFGVKYAVLSGVKS
jgi:hypothetical protein